MPTPTSPRNLRANTRSNRCFRQLGYRPVNGAAELELNIGGDVS